MNKTQKMKNALLASCLLCLGVDYTDATQDRTQLQIHVDQQREYAVINDSQDLDTLINESRDSVYIPNGLYHFWVYGGNVSNIRFIKVEDGTKGIDCFYHWFKNLVGIVLPDSVTSIDKDAFSGCSYLNIRTLPKKLASIGSLAFFGCESLAIEELPGTLLSIGEAAFYKCKNLKKLTVKNDIGSIGTAAFCETGLTRLDLSACNRVFSSSYGDPINNATRVLDRIFGANINQLLWPDGHRELTEAELQVKRRERISENCTVILPGGMGTLVHHNGVWQKQ